ncbi:MAG: glyoxalase [Acidimicrobiia bacterium]|nr:VOC family protein [Acidimicrobiia bacterium]NNF65323.1 glyoxalase [Acidimicrobiia bacterium]
MPLFDLIGIVVEDMAASLAFYRRLGLVIPEEADGEGHVEAELPGGLRLAWDTVEVIRRFNPEWVKPSGGPAIGLAFKCDSADDVNAMYNTLMAVGVESHKEPWDAFWGQRYAVVKDPDGNHIDLFA